MLRNLFILPALLCFVISGNSAVNVRGKVTDQEKKPVEFAVITLLSSADSSLVKGAISASDGTFVLENIQPGNYLATYSFTGFEKVWKGPFEIADGADFSLPDAELLPSKQMDEVTIRAAMPLFQQKPGKLVMNVESSPIRIAGTAWDLLSKCPGVFIDQNSNITMKGRQGVQVYIDDRPTYLGGDGLKNYLQGIPAADIANVELIYNPSARYDAEGTAGIINLVTKKGARQGLNASARLGYGYGFRPKYYSGFNFNYAKEKYNIYGSITENRRYTVDQTYIDRYVPYNGDTTLFSQNSYTYSNSPVNIARFGIDFTPKEKISFGFRTEGFYAPEKDLGENSTLISGGGSDSTLNLKQTNYINENSANGGGSIYYKQQFDSLGKELSLSSDYLRFANRNNQKYNLHFYDQSGMESINPSFQRSDSKTDIEIFVLKADYTHPFNEKYKLETGVKSSYVKTDNALNFELLQNSQWENDTTRTNQFIYTEQINAAYINGSASFKKVEIMAGLRAEQTISDGNSPTTGQELKRKYLQFFPSVFVTHKINDKNTISYTYARRINRPDYENLNPFVYFLDQYTYQTGNPFLQPEIANEGDITYTYLDAAYLTVGFSKTTDAMQDVTQQIDSTGVTFQTTKNFNNIEGAYAAIGIPVPIGSWFLMENNISYSAMRFQTDLFGTPIDNKTSFVNLSTNVTFTLKHDWKIQAWSWYQSGFTYGIFKIKSQSGTGCSFSKGMLNNKLQLSLSFYDIFRKNGNRVTVNFQNQNVKLRTVPESPQLNFMLRYNFGNSKAAKKSQFQSGADDLKDRTGK